MLEANKKHVSLKSFSLKIRIDSVNQILRNKEKVNKSVNEFQTRILTRIPDRKILRVYSCLSNDIKNRGPGPCNSLRHIHDRKYFSGLSNTKSKGSVHDPLGEGSERNLEMILLRKR